MPSKIPDLWSDDITVDVLTPLAILRAQVQGLERRTKGLLEVEINSQEKDREVEHWFDLVAPALGFRERILQVIHGKFMVYPVRLFAEGLDQGSGTAMSQEEFVNLLRKVLRSGQVRASIQSLIARSNETKAPSGPLTPGGTAAIAPSAGANDKSDDI